MLAGAVVLYPALLLVGTFGAYSVEWGSAVLPRVRVWSELLWMLLLILQVLWRYLRRGGVLLEEGVEAGAAFVLLDGSGQLLLGTVPLMELLRRRVQARRVLWLILRGATLSASGRLPSSNCVLARLLCGVFVLVAAGQSSGDAAEARLFGRLLRVHRHGRLLRARASLIEARWGIWRAALLLVALQLVVRAQAVALGGARGALGVRLLLRWAILLLLLRDTERRLLQRGLLAELGVLLPVGILELVVHCASAYGQPHELPTLLDLQPRTYQKAQETIAQTGGRQTCATCSTT